MDVCFEDKTALQGDGKGSAYGPILPFVAILCCGTAPSRPDFDAGLQRFNILGCDFAGLS